MSNVFNEINGILKELHKYGNGKKNVSAVEI